MNDHAVETDVASDYTQLTESYEFLAIFVVPVIVLFMLDIDQILNLSSFTE